MQYSPLKLYKMVHIDDSDKTKLEFAVDLETAERKTGYKYSVVTITKFTPGNESILPIVEAERIAFSRHYGNN